MLRTTGWGTLQGKSCVRADDEKFCTVMEIPGQVSNDFA
jgi:hypothetical protein